MPDFICPPEFKWLEVAGYLGSYPWTQFPPEAIDGDHLDWACSMCGCPGSKGHVYGRKHLKALVWRLAERGITAETYAAAQPPRRPAALESPEAPQAPRRPPMAPQAPRREPMAQHAPRRLPEAQQAPRVSQQASRRSPTRGAQEAAGVADTADDEKEVRWKRGTYKRKFQAQQAARQQRALTDAAGSWSAVGAADRSWSATDRSWSADAGAASASWSADAGAAGALWSAGAAGAGGWQASRWAAHDELVPKVEGARRVTVTERTNCHLRDEWLVMP